MKNFLLNLIYLLYVKFQKFYKYIYLRLFIKSKELTKVPEHIGLCIPSTSQIQILKLKKLVDWLGEFGIEAVTIFEESGQLKMKSDFLCRNDNVRILAKEDGHEAVLRAVRCLAEDTLACDITSAEKLDAKLIPDGEIRQDMQLLLLLSIEARLEHFPPKLLRHAEIM